MKDRTIDFDLLQRLADHLKNGELLHDNFNFRYYNLLEGVTSKIYNGVEISNCGTAGCAIGELPAVDHNRFSFKRGYVWDMITSKAVDFESNPFNLSENEYDHLFLPNNQKPYFGGSLLGDTATKEQVANNIQIFIDKFKQQ